MIVVYVVLAVLVLAVGWLFAMMSHLAAGLPEVAAAFQSQQHGLQRVSEIDRGVPMPALPGRTNDGPAILVILSSTCNSCLGVASQLREGRLGELEGWAIALLVSGPTIDYAAKFATANGLGRYDPFIDAQGEWCRTELGIAQSPVAVIFRDGLILDAYAFGALDDLRAQLRHLREGSEAGARVARHMDRGEQNGDVATLD